MADLTRRQIAMMADEVGVDYPAAVRLVRRAFEVSRSARAALAEPVPEDDVALLREALLATAAQRRAEDDARAALEADGPAVPEGREPAFVVDQPSDEEIIQEAIKADLVYRPIDDESHVFSVFVESHALNTYVLSFARAVLARWGHQPAPPAAGEVKELVAPLRRASDGASAMGWEQDSWVIARAADLLAHSDLLAQRPEPVPVAERPWEREGWCDDQGRCWWTAGPDGRLPLSLWLVNDPAVCTSGVMLSAHAIQVPAGEVEA